MAALDPTDRWLIELLQKDASLSYAALGKTVGLSVSAVNERVRKLLTRGVIRRYSIDVDPAALGLHLLAFVQVQLDRPKAADEFVKRVLDLPEVLECHHVTGPYAYLLKVRVRSTPDLEKLITKRINAVKGVARSDTIIALSSPKETTTLDTRPPKGNKGEKGEKGEKDSAEQ